MSIKVMSLVQEYDGGDMSMAEGAILLSYASFSSQEGENAWPSYSTVARHAKCTTRTVGTTTKKLIEKGFLAKVSDANSVRKTAVYRVNLDRLHPGSSFTRENASPVKMTAHTPEGYSYDTLRTVITPLSPNGDTSPMPEKQKLTNAKVVCPWQAEGDLPQEIIPIAERVFSEIRREVPWEVVRSGFSEFVEYWTTQAKPSACKKANWPAAYRNDLKAKISRGYFDHATIANRNTRPAANGPKPGSAIEGLLRWSGNSDQGEGGSGPLGGNPDAGPDNDWQTVDAASRDTGGGHGKG